MKLKSQTLWMGGIVLLLLLILLAPFFSGMTLLPSDTVKSLPFARFGESEMFQHGRIAQWMPYLFGGMPCYSSLMVTPSYLASVVSSWGLGSFLPIFRDPIVLHFFHLLLLGMGSFLYLRRRGLSWPAAGFGALTLTLSTTLTGLMGAGHTIKLWTVCWMPLNLYWLERLLEERRWRTLVPAALCLGLMLTVKHVQMSWYFLIFAGLYTLVRLWQMRDAEGRIWLGGGLRALAWVGLGLALAAFLYLPVLEYSSMSMRSGSLAAIAGGSYAGAYSFPPSDLLTWWIPGARGFGGGSYWGELDYTAFPLYAGALWLPLLGLAFWKAEDRRRLWPWLLPALLLLVLGLGTFTPLFPLLVKALPGYAKLRAHMWALAPVQMGLIFGAALGLERLLRLAHAPAGPRPAQAGLSSPVGKWLLGVSMGSLLLSGLCYLAIPDPGSGIGQGSSFQNMRGPEKDEQAAQYNIAYDLYQRGLLTRESMPFPPGQVQQEVDRMRTVRAGMYRGDAARTLLLVGLAGLGLWLLVLGRLKTPALAVWLGLLGAGDLLLVDKRALSFEPRQSPAALFRPQGWSQSALAQLAALPDKASFRIWPDGVYGTNEPAWDGLHSIEGYHGAKPAGIQQVLTEGRVPLADGSQTLDSTWLDLLNVEWVISRALPPGLLPVGQFPDGFLLRNLDALPRLSFPAAWEAVPGPEQFQHVMQGLEPRRLALVDPVPELPARLAAAQGTVVSYEPERVEYAITSAGPSLALLSEIWLPKGWVATLDGGQVPILRADHLLRAVALPTAGDHRLVLEYRPLAWRVGRWISLVTLAGLLLAFFGWRRHHPEDSGKGTAA